MFFLISNDTPCCPICGEPLVYRDMCRRKILLEGREEEVYLIRRLKCTGCGRLHRELADFMVPYKQYAAGVIMDILDGIGPEPDDYPCEVTGRRWHHWMMANELRVDGYLKSIGYRLLGYGRELLYSDASLLDSIRGSGSHWLCEILRFIYNSGGFLVPA